MTEPETEHVSQPPLRRPSSVTMRRYLDVVQRLLRCCLAGTAQDEVKGDISEIAQKAPFFLSATLEETVLHLATNCEVLSCSSGEMYSGPSQSAETRGCDRWMLAFLPLRRPRALRRWQRASQSIGCVSLLTVAPRGPGPTRSSPTMTCFLL